MKLNPFRKPPPLRRRRRKKSHKWIDRAKAEVNRMPSLDNLEEDVVIKAAILCTAGNYVLRPGDFKLHGTEQAAVVLKIILDIQVLQKEYPHYLQYARWVAIKAGLELIEGKRHGYRKPADDDETALPPGMAPPPDMGRLMQEEWERHRSEYYKRRNLTQ